MQSQPLPAHTHTQPVLLLHRTLFGDMREELPKAGSFPATLAATHRILLISVTGLGGPLSCRLLSSDYLRWEQMPIDPISVSKLPASLGIEPGACVLLSDDRTLLCEGREACMATLGVYRGNTGPDREDIALGTLAFHTVAEAFGWLVDHPLPALYLEQAILKGAEAIRSGKLVAFPTETVYGLGADATDAEAVASIFTAKQRPFHDPLIVHVSDRSMVDSLVTSIPDAARMLMDRFWPGPLTVVLEKSDQVPSIATAGTSTVAIRMPAHPTALALIRQSGRPIAAPSANRFGRTSPTTARHVQDQLEGAYAVLIDGGACPVGVESTVISFTATQPEILRPGGISREMIEQAIGPVLVQGSRKASDSGSDQSLPKASPGMLVRHYAPRTPMILVPDADRLLRYALEAGAGLLAFGHVEIPTSVTCINLSSEGSPEEAASRLYKGLRELDCMQLPFIASMLLPEQGIGAAVNDRMRKAAADGMKLLAEGIIPLL